MNDTQCRAIIAAILISDGGPPISDPVAWASKTALELLPVNGPYKDFGHATTGHYCSMCKAEPCLLVDLPYPPIGKNRRAWVAKVLTNVDKCATWWAADIGLTREELEEHHFELEGDIWSRTLPF